MSSEQLGLGRAVPQASACGQQLLAIKLVCQNADFTCAQQLAAGHGFPWLKAGSATSACGVKKHRLFGCLQGVHEGMKHAPGALPPDAPGQLDVLGHDGDTLGRQHRAGLEAQVGLEVLRDLAHEALEGQLADEQLRGLL
eukprot:1136625-Pelagomonas_calceolata.AAC.1